MTDPFQGLIQETDDTDDPFAGLADQPLAKPPGVGFGNAVKDSFSGAIDAVGEAYRDPSVISRAGGNAVAGLGELGKSLYNAPLQTAKALVVDGIIKPFIVYPIELAWDSHVKAFVGEEAGILTEEERYSRGREVTGNYAGLAVGFGIGKVFAAGGAAAKLKDLGKVKSLDDLRAKMPELPPDKLIQLHELATQPQFGATVRKAVSEGVGGGVTTGLLIGDTAEERFSNAFSYGVAGALLGTALEVGLGGKTRAQVRSLGEQAQATAVLKNSETIRTLPASNQVRAAADLLDGVPIDELMLRHLPHGQTLVIDGLPKVSKVILDSKNAVVYKGEKGYSVFIDGRFDPVSELADTKVVDGEGKPMKMYHGTRAVFPEFDVSKADKDAVYGPGIYSTNDALVAGGDVRQGLDGYSRLLDAVARDEQVQITKNKVSKFEKALGRTPDANGFIEIDGFKYTKETLDEYIKNGREMIDELSTSAPNVHPLYMDLKNPLNMDLPVPREQIAKIIDVAGKENLGTVFEGKLAEEFSGMAVNEVHHGDYLYNVLVAAADDAQPGFGKEIVRDILERAGYDGIMHTGGTRVGSLTGGPLHQVAIAFRERSVVSAVVKESAFTPEQIAGIKKNGFIPNEIVNIAGSEHIVLGQTKNRFQVQNMITGDVRFVKRSSISRGERLEMGYMKDNELPANAEGSIPTYRPERIPIGSRRGFASMIDEIKASLNEEEMGIVNANRDKIDADFVVESMTLAQKATVNGYGLKHVDGGAVEVIDAGTGNMVATLKTAEDAAKFIESNGRRIGNVQLRIDGPARGSGLPPSAPVSNDSAPIKYNEARTPEKIRAIITLKSHLIQPTREVMLAVETMWKDSGFYTKVFRPTQEAYLKFNANRQPWLNSLSEIGEVIKDLNPDERAMIFDYLETMTPDEIKLKLIRNRTLSKAEIRIAEGIAAGLKGEQGANSIVRAFEWLAAKRDLSQKAFTAYEQSAKLSDVEKHAATILETLKSSDKSETSVYAITRLARAILLDTPDRKTFAANNKMKPAALNAAAMLEKWFDALSPIVGIDSKQMLNGYISHIRNVDQGTRNVKALSQFNGEGATDFIHSLTRTGEINNLVRDPIEIALKYLSAGMRAKFLSKEIEAARKAVKNGAETIANDPTTRSSAAAVKAQKWGSEYLDNLTGVVDGHDAIVTAAFDKFLDRVAPSVGTGPRQTFSNALVRSVEFAAQGMKPLAGIRDGSTTTQIFTTRFGFTRFARGLHLFHEAMKSKDLLQLYGEIPGLTAQYTETAADAAARQSLTGLGKAGSNVAGAFKKVSDLGFTVSLQPNVYATTHSFVFLESWDHIGRAVNDFVKSKGAMKLEAFEHRIALDTYGTPIQNQFRDLMNNGQYSKAVNFLAKVTGEEVVGVYGMANHPALMRSQTGKVLGQFGQWPMWYLNAFGRMVTQGSPKRVVAMTARFGALIGAMNAAQAATGFNLRNWQANPQQALGVFEGSPSWQAFKTIAAALGSQNDYMHDIAVNELKRQVDLTKPTIGILPKPLFIYNGVEGVQRMLNGDPLHIVGWKLLGGGIDNEAYPKP